MYGAKAASRTRLCASLSGRNFKCKLGKSNFAGALGKQNANFTNSRIAEFHVVCVVTESEFFCFPRRYAESTNFISSYTA